MLRRLVFRAFVSALLLSGIALAKGVTVRFEPTSPEVGPFPSDALTVTDWDQKTGRRINLPLPDCAVQVSDCALKRLLNEYDGFNPNPRMRVRFSAPVDLETLRRGVFLIALENMTAEEAGTAYTGTPISINQLVWDPETNSLFAKPDVVLDQHRRYALIVTDAVRDTRGDPVEADPAFTACVANPVNAHCRDLAGHLYFLWALAERLGGTQRVVAASIFTTLSATSWLEKARDLLPQTPTAVRPTGQRSIFSAADIASLTLRQHTGVSPVAFTNSAIATNRLAGIRSLAFGSYRSPSYSVEREIPLWGNGRFPMIATVPSALPLGAPARIEELVFQATLPDAPKPAGGYPVVILGHGSTTNKLNMLPSGLAQSMAAEGYATIAINGIGAGLGPESRLVITERNGSVTEVFFGGRGIDTNRDGTITPGEGCDVNRDCLRQILVDLMQLVLAIRSGIDLDGDGRPDLDPSRIYYYGYSWGATYGTAFMALEPAVSCGVLSLNGNSVENWRWSPVNKPDVFNILFAARTPPVPPNAGNQYDDDYVLRDQPVKVTRVSGAIELQNVLELVEWFTAPGNPQSYAPHLRASTLLGVPIKRVLFQVARGDQTVTNPSSSDLIRSAYMPDWWVLYRHDLARAIVPQLAANPHGVFWTMNSTVEAQVAIAQAGHKQAALFFSTGQGCSLLEPCIADMGSMLIPVFGRNVFEIAPPTLPEDLGFLMP